MIRHICKLIWNERKTNVLIFLEFILIFCILWFCADYLWFTGNRYFEPRGFDIKNTYLLNMGERKNRTEELRQRTSEEAIEDALALMERVGRYPGVKAISLSYGGIPYGKLHTFGSYAIDTSHVAEIQVKAVTQSYFDVFRIPLAQGRLFSWRDSGQEKNVVISPDHKGEFIRTPAGQVEHFYHPRNRVSGVTEKIKIDDFKPYGNVLFEPMLIINDMLSEPAIRVSPEADNGAFAERFFNDMRDQLDFGYRYLQSVTPFSEIRREMNRYIYYNNRLNGVFSVTGFLIINIFLGVLGTFWLRTQSRRSEIGLRMALGASRRRVQGLLLGETVLLLAGASVVGAVICLNIGQTSLLGAIGVPAIDREKYGIGAGQDAINFALTFAFLAAVSALAVWYPSRRAAATQPAEALHEE